MGQFGTNARIGVKYCLAVEAVHEINRSQVAKTNEPFGLRNENGLLSALARPLTFVGGRFAFPTPIARTSALLESLFDAHPYLQGNKRTAWRAAVVYLELQNIEVVPSVTDAEALEFILKGINERMDHHEIANWLEPRTVPHFGLRSI